MVRHERRIISQKRRETLWGFAFLLPSMFGTAIFLLLPSLDTMRRAFTSPAGGFAWLRNFQIVLGNEAFGLAAFNTGRFMAVCVPLLIALSLALAFFLDNVQNAKLRAAFLLPMAIPVASVALLWQLFFSDHGALNGVLQSMDMASKNWMNAPSAFWILVGSYIWRNIGYDMVLFLAALSAIPASLYEAADIDGAGAWYRFIHITMPLLSPSLYMITVLSLLNAFKVFREAFLVSGSYPHESIYMIQHLFNNWFSKLEMDKLSAAAVLMAIVVFALIVLLRSGLDKSEDAR